MASPQKMIYGSWSQGWAGLAVATLFGLGLAHVWEFPFTAAQNGGFAFVLAWLLFMVVLAVPLRMLEVMLGRRSRRAPVEGMAHLTREADAPRFWRAASWGSLIGAYGGMVGLALLAGWAVSFLGHRAISEELFTAIYSGSVWPIGTGLVLVIAAVLAKVGLQRLAPLYLVLWALVGVLLLAAAAYGVDSAGVLLAFKPEELTAAGWAAAAKYALLSTGGGLGLLWLAGSYLPEESRPAGLAVPAVFLQILMTLVAALALSPYLNIVNSLPGESILMQRLPAAMTSGDLLPWFIFSALAISTLAALAALGEVIIRFWQERKVADVPALVLTFAVAALVAEAVWFFGANNTTTILLEALRVWLLLVLLGWAIFGGWVMKISHARKEFNFSNELIYNLWRVAVRILCPLALVAALAGVFL